VKVYTMVSFLWDGKQYVPDFSESFEYEGPVAKCDRWAQGQEKGLTGESRTQAGQYGEEAATAGSQLTPFYSQEMRAEHSMDPTQINEQLTMMGAGTGGALGATEGMAQEEEARTRNASGFAKTLDEAARARQKAAAGLSEGIAAEDVKGALALRQAGAAGLAGQRGQDIDAQLKAMGQASEEAMNEVQASQTGWFQNLQQGVKMATSLGNPFK